MTQTDLFSQVQEPSGRDLRDKGIESVLAHTPETYRDSFLRAIIGFPSGFRYTAEQVRDVVGEPPAGTHFNCIGGLMRQAGMSGLAIRTTERVKATRPSLHARELAVWRRA